MFFVGRGVDFIDGAGGTDELRVDGALNEWTIVMQADGSVLATHATWGANTLVNVETISFARTGETLSVADAVAQTPNAPTQLLDDDNVINGTNGDDTLTAVDGIQGLYGGVGNDTYIGQTAGSQINYDGLRSEYAIVQNGDGSITVAHDIWGTDTLINIDPVSYTHLTLPTTPYV